MNASRNIWAVGLCDLDSLISQNKRSYKKSCDLDSLISQNKRSYKKSNCHGWSSQTLNYEFPGYLSEWSTPLSNAETDDFFKILGLQEDELFYLQVPMRSSASRDDINHCSYGDINESGFQIRDNFEDTFDEIEDALEGRKGWGDYFDDGDSIDDSQISDGDSCNIDHFHHSQELESSETDELGFQDCKTGTEYDEEALEWLMVMHKIWESDFYHSQEEVESTEIDDEIGFQVCETGTEDDEEALQRIMAVHEMCDIDLYHSQEVKSSETNEFGFKVCEIGMEDDEEALECITVMDEMCEIDLYHSQEEVESSETIELGFQVCETRTEDDEEALGGRMVMHEIENIDFYHSQEVESSETDELGFQDCKSGTEDELGFQDCKSGTEDDDEEALEA